MAHKKTQAVTAKRKNAKLTARENRIRLAFNPLRTPKGRRQNLRLQTLKKNQKRSVQDISYLEFKHKIINSEPRPVAQSVAPRSDS